MSIARIPDKEPPREAVTIEIAVDREEDYTWKREIATMAEVLRRLDAAKEQSPYLKNRAMPKGPRGGKRSPAQTLRMAPGYYGGDLR